MAYNPKYSAQNEARRRERSHRVALDYERGYYADVLQPAAERAGETVAGYIKKAVAERIEREKTGDSGPA